MDELVKQVWNNHERGSYSVAVSHFKVTQELVLLALESVGTMGHVVSSSNQFPGDVLSELRAKAPVLMFTSDCIPYGADKVSGQRKDPKAPKVWVYLTERYPLPGRDDLVLALDKVWRSNLVFTSYTALDEPWLAPFGMEQIQELMQKLGMIEGESLDNPLISKALDNAQKKIAQTVLREQPCESCQEWMERNLPGRG